MRILLIKLGLPVVLASILFEPFIGVLFFMLIAFVRLEVLTWNMVDARFALYTSLITLGSWLIHGLGAGDTRQRASRIPGQFWWYLLVIFWMGVTTLTAEASVDNAWRSVQKFFKYSVFLYLMIQMINTEKRLRMVQEVVFWGVNFLVVWGIDQYFRGNYRLEKVGGGDFADSSGLAALFLLTFPMVIYRFYHPNKWVRRSGIFFAPLYLVAVTMTESRSGFLGALAALCLMFARARQKLKYSLLFIPIGLAVLIFMPDSFSDRMKTITSGTEEGEVRERSADQRVKVWTVAVAVFEDHPFLGVGRQNFGLIHDTYAYPIWYGVIPDDLYDDLFRRYRVCHNLWLDLLVSNGLITFIPWCLLVGSVPFSLWRMRRRLRTDEPMEVYWLHQSYGIEAGILAYLITGTFQDLAEVEVFYWIVLLAGITRTIVDQRVAVRERRTGLPAPVPVPTLGRPPAAPARNGQKESPANPWHDQPFDPIPHFAPKKEQL